MGVFTMQGQGVPCCSSIRFGTPPPPPHQRASPMPRRGPQQTRQYPLVGPKAGGRAAPPNSQAACSTPHATLSASGEHPATPLPPPPHTHPRYTPPSHAWPGALEMSESQAFPEESGLEGGLPPFAELHMTTADHRPH
nr:uncharacterized protein LOC129014131 [Pongo pygmaeus]